MPKYIYKCTDCKSIVAIYHSMSDKREKCEDCGKQNSLQKLPTQFVLDIREADKKVGDIVKRSIEEFKSDLDNQKEKLSNELYSSNE